ncbi:urease accessory protein UreD, partial [Streptomyces violascens]
MGGLTLGAPGVRAAARVVATPEGLPVLEGEGPLALRRTRARGPYHRVTVVGAMSAPLGGDRIAGGGGGGGGGRGGGGTAAPPHPRPRPDGGGAPQGLIKIYQ